VLKIVAAIAAVVAIFVPLGTFNQFLIFCGSVGLGILCFIASSALEDDDAESLSFWPPKSSE
jgi:hypothetical protein